MKKVLIDRGMALFWCEGCQRVHMLNVSLEGSPKWDFNGSEESPTFKPSVLAKYQHPKGYSNENPAPVGYSGEMVTDACHSFITDGRIEYLGDSTHHLAGKTVDLLDWSEDFMQ